MTDTLTFTEEDVASAVDELLSSVETLGIGDRVRQILGKIQSQSGATGMRHALQVSRLLNIFDGLYFSGGWTHNADIVSQDQAFINGLNNPDADFGQKSPYEAMIEDPEYWLPIIKKQLEKRALLR